MVKHVPGGFKPDFHGNRKRFSGRNSRFLQKAKKFGQQGKFGRGHHVDDATYNYFLRVMQIHNRNEFDSEEEKAAFVRNSLDETVGEEVNLAKNQMVSRVLQNILADAEEEVLLRVCNAFTPQLRVVCVDPFASHVLEKMLEVTSQKWKTSEALTTWFRDTCKFILNNFAEFSFNTYANGVMRKVFYCLSGNFPTSEESAAKIQVRLKLMARRQSGEVKQIEEENAQILKEFQSQFLNWNQFNDLMGQVHTSALVQTLVVTLSALDVELACQVAMRVMEGILPDFSVGNTHAMHLLESCAQVPSESLFELLWNKYLDSRFDQFVCHGKGQHLVRKLIDACQSKEAFEKIYDLVEPHFEKLLKLECTNTLVSCSKGCMRFGTKQADFTKKIKSAIMAEEGEGDFIMRLAKLNKNLKEEPSAKYLLLELNGTLILEHMLYFHKPLMVVKDLLSMDRSSLFKLASDTKGSHVMTTFFKSETVGDKSKEQMLTKLKEDLATMACTKYGSRVIDSMWAWAGIKQKVLIASELSQHIPKLSADLFGVHIATKMALHSYKRDPKKWQEFQQSSGKREAELEDLNATIAAMTENNIPVKEEPDDAVSSPQKKNATPAAKRKAKQQARASDTLNGSTVSVKEEDAPSEQDADADTPPQKKKRLTQNEKRQAKLKELNCSTASVAEEDVPSDKAGDTPAATPQKKKRLTRNEKRQAKLKELNGSTASVAEEDVRSDNEGDTPVATPQKKKVATPAKGNKKGRGKKK